MRLTREELKESLNYNPETGVFTWKVRRKNSVQIGDVAGTKHPNGYIVIMVHGKLYGAHRLAWLYVHGYLPEYDVDHINRIKDNNRIINLREVSRSCNMRNTGNHKDNTSGVKGVGWAKRENKWYAQIRVNQKGKSLGYYVDFQDAVCARLAGEQACNWSGCDSNSPAFQYVKNKILNNY